ncbi:hypothetical protein C8R43DRAFT_1152572 [Mycena crocata]|nr:hypothetical protein C8R43DRAFT_1152572 [Mycena crocata]
MVSYSAEVSSPQVVLHLLAPSAATFKNFCALKQNTISCDASVQVPGASSFSCRVPQWNAVQRHHRSPSRRLSFQYHLRREADLESSPRTVISSRLARIHEAAHVSRTRIRVALVMCRCVCKTESDQLQPYPANLSHRGQGFSARLDTLRAAMTSRAALGLPTPRVPIHRVTSTRLQKAFNPPGGKLSTDLRDECLLHTQTKIPGKSCPRFDLCSGIGWPSVSERLAPR